MPSENPSIIPSLQIWWLSPYTFGIAPQPLEDPGQLTGDRGFAFAEHPPGVLHQEQVIAQRESFDHPFACRIQPPAILDRTEPQPFFQARRRSRARDAACLGGLLILGSSLLLEEEKKIAESLKRADVRTLVDHMYHFLGETVSIKQLERDVGSDPDAPAFQRWMEQLALDDDQTIE